MAEGYGEGDDYGDSAYKGDDPLTTGSTGQFFNVVFKRKDFDVTMVVKTPKQ